MCPYRCFIPEEAEAAAEVKIERHIYLKGKSHLEVLEKASEVSFSYLLLQVGNRTFYEFESWHLKREVIISLYELRNVYHFLHVSTFQI